jgi:KaiC/GvpD/RAD55 family RecA-like ATPase
MQKLNCEAGYYSRRLSRILSTTALTPTGIPGLDEVLAGGIPRGRVVLVAGGPGTGKTILSTQFLVNGIRTFNENAVFVSLEENKQHYYSEMAKFGWSLAEMEREKKFVFVDASPIRSIPGEVKVGKLTIGKKEFSMLSLIEGIRAAVKGIDAQRLVVDPIASLIFQYPDLSQRRNAVLDLIEALVGTGATCMVNTELRRVGMERRVQPEEYLTHGVIVLQTLQVGRALVRVIQVEKMREAPVDMQPHPYKISETGIEVFAKENVF